MALHHLVLVVFVGILLILKPVYTLNANGRNVCSSLRSSTESYVGSSSYKSSYTKACGLFGWDRCTHYRTKYRGATRYRARYRRVYMCCLGWAQASPGSNDCNVPLCPPRCVHGTCVAPNRCNCYEGFHGSTCETFLLFCP
ncbi:epidermal growth factor-like protein 7 [Anneissia japonica]|uniref:epidermal growth factor-like protein 7 n=1 Tax=Anneissia japonica TaxID=1529436 RepID=UPI001425AC89|nr:epidermal growth factor-like protein 7 [Anneissia japonica]